MTLGGILVLLLLLVSLIVFIYLLVVTARSWGILHSLLLSTLFIECWVFLVFAAGVQAERVKYIQQAAKAQADAESAQERTLQLLWGGFNARSLNLDAVIPATSELRRMTADRGRVWRAVNFVQAAGNGFQLELSAGQAAGAVDPLAEAPAAAGSPSSESLPENMVVYAFGDAASEADGTPLPAFYLGEYTVTQSQDGQVTLTPTRQLLQTQQQYIDNVSADTWTLYELLPLDSHKAFAAYGSQTTEEELFGRMDEEAIATLMSNIPAEDQRQQTVIDQYVRDGKKATEEDQPASIWIRVKFLKDYSLQVDSADVANATERGYFDFEGRSIDGRLQRGEDGTVKLTPSMNEVIVLKEEAALPLIDNGTVELVERFYVRPLNDYGEAFNRLSVRQHDIGEATTLIQRETAELEKANNLGQEMISFRQVEGQKLSGDLGNFQSEVAVLESEVEEAQSTLAELQKNLSDMYRSIQARRRQL